MLTKSHFEKNIFRVDKHDIFSAESYSKDFQRRSRKKWLATKRAFFVRLREICVWQLLLHSYRTQNDTSNRGKPSSNSCGSDQHFDKMFTMTPKHSSPPPLLPQILLSVLFPWAKHEVVVDIFTAYEKSEATEGRNENGRNAADCQPEWKAFWRFYRLAFKRPSSHQMMTLWKDLNSLSLCMRACFRLCLVSVTTVSFGFSLCLSLTLSLTVSLIVAHVRRWTARVYLHIWKKIVEPRFV